MTDNFFQTEDFGLACFLRANNVDLRDINFSQKSTGKCSFTLRIGEDDERLKTLLGEWNYSHRAKEFKKGLFQSKRLKHELKNFLEKNNNSF